MSDKSCPDKEKCNLCAGGRFPCAFDDDDAKDENQQRVQDLWKAVKAIREECERHKDEPCAKCLLGKNLCGDFGVPMDWNPDEVFSNYRKLKEDGNG